MKDKCIRFSISLLIVLSGCTKGVEATLKITNLCTNAVTVRSAYSGKQIRITQNCSAILPHMSGSVDVLLPEGRIWHYPEVSVIEFKRFASPHGHLFKVTELRLNLVLMSNGVIQVVQETNRLRVVIKEIAPFKASG